MSSASIVDGVRAWAGWFPTARVTLATWPTGTGRWSPSPFRMTPPTARALKVARMERARPAASSL